jgi:GNAT superfamily N-acetyltransferase
MMGRPEVDHEHPVEIGVAELADLDGVVRLAATLAEIHARLVPELWGVARHAAVATRNWMEQAIHDPRRRLLVARQYGRVVGFVHAEIVQAPRIFSNERRGLITDVVIHRAARRKGIGGRLVQHAEDWLRLQAVDVVTVSFPAGNCEASAFWTTLGFLPAAPSINHFDDSSMIAGDHG